MIVLQSFHIYLNDFKVDTKSNIENFFPTKEQESIEILNQHYNINSPFSSC